MKSPSRTTPARTATSRRRTPRTPACEAPPPSDSPLRRSLSSASDAVGAGRSRSRSVTGAANEHQPERDLRPGGPPAVDADRGADGGERRREEHAQQDRVDAHRDADAAVERLADGGDAGDRQRALSERARGEHQQRTARAPRRPGGSCVHTTAPSSSVSANVAPRRPTRSNSRPIGRQIAAPSSVAQRLMLA